MKCLGAPPCCCSVKYFSNTLSRMSPLGYADPEDRGPAKYFHGRTTELAIFQSTLGQAHDTNGGTIILFQGPPGAGKTALLHECRKQARVAGWHTAKVDGDALRDPGILAQKLGVRRPTRTIERDRDGIALGIKTVLEIVFRAEADKEHEFPGNQAEAVLQEASGPHGILLTLDEAQDLQGTGQISPAVKNAIRTSLRDIHNGEIGAPVVLVAGGLGTSKKVLQSFGISRFRRRRVCLLGSLSPLESRAVIHDWLVKDGGAPKDHRCLEHWIDTMAAECHGWPQHLQVYAQQAAGWLKHHNGELTTGVPPAVLAEARIDREEYYDGRVSELEGSDRAILANMVRDKGKGSTFLKKEVVAAFNEDRSRAQAEQLFEDLLHKGVIADTGRGRFNIPIPSMYDWLVREYAEPAREAPIRLPAGNRGQERKNVPKS